jgi:hypothetical protein
MGEDQVFLAKVIVPYQDFFRYDKIVYEYVCGDVNQLTKNKKAVLEIEYAIEDMLLQISHSPLKNKFQLIFLSRQILTILKYGNLKIKLRLFSYVRKAFMVGRKEFWCIFFNEFTLSLKKHFKFRGNH